jgi:hypothetical protein
MKANYDNKTKAEGSLNMNLYDLNKQIIAQLPDYTDEDYEIKREMIDEFGRGKTWCLLLGREMNYYTVFHNLIKDADETFADAVISCCKYLGQVKSINWPTETSRDAIEIWVMHGEEPTVLYLFDYEAGVIECQM